MPYKLIETRLYANEKNDKFRVAYCGENGGNTIKTFTNKAEALAFKEATKPKGRKPIKVEPEISIIEDLKMSSPIESPVEKESVGKKQAKKPAEMEITEIFNPFDSGKGDLKYMFVSRDTNFFIDILANLSTQE